MIHTSSRFMDRPLEINAAVVSEDSGKISFSSMAISL
jgi:hypothetical protein